MHATCFDIQAWKYDALKAEKQYPVMNTAGPSGSQ
jgi:hypothetical protein